MPGGRQRYTYIEVSPTRVPVIEDRRPEVRRRRSISRLKELKPRSKLYHLFRSPRRKTVVVQESRNSRQVRFARSPSPIVTEARSGRPRNSSRPPRIITISPSGRLQRRRDRTPSPEPRSSQYPTREELAAMSPHPPPVQQDFVPLPDPLPKPKKKSRPPSIDVDKILGYGDDRSLERHRHSTSRDDRYDQYEYVSSPKSGRKKPRGSSQVPRTIKDDKVARELVTELDKLELDRQQDKKYYEDQIRQLKRTVGDLRQSERDAMQRLDSKNAQLRRLEVENAEARLRDRESRLEELVRRQWAEMGAPLTGPALMGSAHGQAQVIQQTPRPVSRDVVEALIHQAQDDVRQNEEQYHTDRERHRSSGERRGSITAYPDSRHRPRYQ